MSSEKEQKRDRAVALRYNKESENAPKVVAKGSGKIADEIKRVAQESGVPISQNPDLVELLSFVELDSEISSELYGAVAEILSWVYKANEEMKLK